MQQGMAGQDADLTPVSDVSISVMNVHLIKCGCANMRILKVGGDEVMHNDEE